LGAIETSEWLVCSGVHDPAMKARPLLVFADMIHCEFAVSERFRKAWDWDSITGGGWPL
jgi:hypothetical protein